MAAIGGRQYHAGQTRTSRVPCRDGSGHDDVLGDTRFERQMRDFGLEIGAGILRQGPEDQARHPSRCGSG